MTDDSMTLIQLLVRSGSSCDAANIIAISNSIITAGFKAEEAIVARDLPDSQGDLGTCRLGDGVKRALAAKLVPLGFMFVFMMCFSFVVNHCKMKTEIVVGMPLQVGSSESRDRCRKAGCLCNSSDNI